MLPHSRTDQVSVQDLPEETIIFDHQTGKAHCLNRTAALVWKLADGKTSVAELARRLETHEAAVELALEQLQRRRLLQGPFQELSEEKRRSRRDLLKKLGAAALALPVIMTVTAPGANAAASGCTSDANCSTLNGNSGCRIGRCRTGQCVAANAAELTGCGGGRRCCSGNCVLPATSGPCSTDCQCEFGCFAGSCSSG